MIFTCIFLKNSVGEPVPGARPFYRVPVKTPKNSSQGPGFLEGAGDEAVKKIKMPRRSQALLRWSQEPVKKGTGSQTLVKKSINDHLLMFLALNLNESSCASSSYREKQMFFHKLRKNMVFHQCELSCVVLKVSS